MFDAVTAFDALVAAIVIMSALMAFSRGFMRELATLSALLFASAATYFAHTFFRDKLAALLPEGVSDFSADAIVIGVSFLVVYIIVRMASGRFTQLIQGKEGVSMVDRLAGMAFGVVRGLALPFILAWGFINFVPSEAIPEFVSNSATYPHFEHAASAFNANLPDIAGRTDAGLFEAASEGAASE